MNSLQIGRIVLAAIFVLVSLALLIPGVVHRDHSPGLINFISRLCAYIAGILIGSALYAL